MHFGNAACCWSKHKMPLQKTKSMQARSRSKKKDGKLPIRDANNTINPDLSSLRKPIDTSVSTLYRVNKLLEDGTEEVKSILSYECDIIYECRICRSLFRSIVNFISHKREYCREKFNITLHRSELDDFNTISSKGSLIHKIEQAIINDNVKNNRILRSQVSKEARKRDLSTIIDTLSKRQQENIERNCSSRSKVEDPDVPSNQHIYLEPIDTNNSVVYQTLGSSDTIVDTNNLIKGQIAELQDMMDRCTVTLGSTREREKDDPSPVQVDTSDKDNELLIGRSSTTDSLICAICNAKFSTKKTLTFHMKTLHTSKRMCYLCPCCTSTFANTWSVYRHLYKVHRKNNEQVRKLRSHIQEKAFHVKTTGMKDLAKARAIKASAMENVTTRNNAKKWLYQSESDGERHSCIRCGKKFERKAALSAHLQYCHASIESACRKVTAKIRRSNKTLSNSTLNNTLCRKDTDAVITTMINPSSNRDTLDVDLKHTSSLETIDKNHETSICVQAISSLNKEDWDMLDNDYNCSSECNSTNNNNDIITSSTTQNTDDSESLSTTDESRDHLESINKNSQSPEILCTSTSEASPTTLKTERRKEKMSSQRDEKQSIDLEEKVIVEMRDNNPELQPLCPSETEQTLLMENKIATIANLQKLQCLLCKRKFTSMISLHRHLAIHMGWYRYRCKLCDFKCFVKCDGVAHCNKVHNAQNNRATIAGTMIEIPQNECTHSKDIVDVTDKNIDDPDITAPSSRPVTHEEWSNSSDTCTRITSHNEATVVNERESCKNVECEIVENNEKGCGEIAATQDLEYMMNCRSGKLDAHPDLKRMVMEVIFGPSDTPIAIKQSGFGELTLDTVNDAGRNLDANDNEDDVKSTEKSRETSCSNSPKRPARNRIKLLNKDFVYDLKERTSSRKDGAFFKEPSLRLDKSLAKRHLHLCNSETLNMQKKAKLYN